MKKIIALVVMLSGMIGWAGDSAPFLLDTMTEPMITAPITYNSAWIGGNSSAVVVISADVSEINRMSGEGDFTWSPTTVGKRTLTYTTYINGVAHDEVYTATVYANWKYTLEDGKATIVETTQTSGDVIIPSEIDGYPVVGLGDGLFANSFNLSSVLIPTGITNIGVDTFLNCPNLSIINGKGCEELYLRHIEVETKSAKAAACTEDGWTKEVSCSRCKAVLVASTVLPKLGHIEVETKAAKAATCTEDGCTKEVTCSRCKSVLVASTVLPKLGHIEVETKAAKAATCTEDGWTKEVTCSRCKAVVSVSTIVPKFGHSHKTTITPIAPTCTEGGRTAEIICSRCNVVLESSQVLPSLGHSGAITKHAVAPTSSNPGQTAEITCTRCAQVLQEQKEIPALGYIRNVTARQIWPHKKVEITYELAEDIDDVLTEDAELAVRMGDEIEKSVPQFSNDATYPWTADTGYRSDTVSYKSGNEGKANSKSARSVTVAGVSNVSFYWKVSSEPKYDKLRFLVDGSDAVTAISGWVGWTKVEVALDGNMSHTLKWSYEKNGIVDNNYDCGWVDCIEFTYVDTAVSAKTLLGDSAPNPGQHCIVWNMESDRVVVNESEVLLTIGYHSIVAETTLDVVNTSSSVKNGMSVEGSLSLGYSPFADGVVSVQIDGANVFSSTNSGTFVWQPRATGTHTIKHISGDYEWTRMVNVTSLAFEIDPTPNPPTGIDSNIKINSTTKSFAQAGGTGAITTSGSGTLAVNASADWITITSASSAGRPIAYKVAANNAAESRTGYIYISGHVFTVTQEGVGGALDIYSAEFETDGGRGVFGVIVDAGVTWKAQPNVDWISVDSTVGTGEGEVAFTVAPWDEVSTRVGTITAAGNTFTVTQTGRRMKLSVNAIEHDYLSHALDIQVNALSTTSWDIELGASWISVVDGGRGKGSDDVFLAINENPSYAPRQGVVRIGTEKLLVTQAGRPTAALAFSISPVETTAAVDGANAILAVAATPDLPWEAKSEANWLTIMPTFKSGAGNGNVIYTASPNPTMASRTGRITVSPSSETGVAALTHTVTQPAATALISANEHTFDAAGSSFDVAVTIADVVNWSIVKGSASWITVSGSLSRIGPDTVTIAAQENLTTEARQTTITIAGHVFTVHQPGRRVNVEYEAKVFGTAEDYGTLEVQPDGNVTWKAVVSEDALEWLVIWGENCDYDDDGNLVGVGEQTIEYIVTEYNGDGSPRTGTITIGDKVIYVTQRAYELNIEPSATWVSGNAGAGSVSVPASIGDVWNAISTEPWITVVSGSQSGTGSGTVQYTFTENNTGEVRTGRIIIAGEEYTITQAARQMVAIDIETVVVSGSGELGSGNGGVVSGAGVYELGAEVTLTATANDGYTFVGWTVGGNSLGSASTVKIVADVDKEVVAIFKRLSVYLVNGEAVREGTTKTFTAPEAILDEPGTTKVVCKGSSRFPEKGSQFSFVVTEDVSFEWDLWETNYFVSVQQPVGGVIKENGVIFAGRWVKSGDELTLTAYPNSGQTFFRWQLSPVDGVTKLSTSESFSLTVTKPQTVSALFGVFNDTLATALDVSQLVFTTGGDAEWLPLVDATAEAGYTSAQSGIIGKESETWLETTVHGSGELSFRWKVDCEKDDGGEVTWDRLSVFVNGVEAARIDGKTSWQRLTLPVSGEKTVIRWSFYRDDYDELDAECQNKAWVDDVQFTAKEGK